VARSGCDDSEGHMAPRGAVSLRTRGRCGVALSSRSRFGVQRAVH
jgi:hypothetical protein